MMRLEAVRVVADALTHPDIGVNALLAGVPRDADDPIPAPVGGVYDETRHECVARRTLPPMLPCLYVMMDGTVRVNGEQLAGTYRETNGAPLYVTVRYLAAAQDTYKALRDGDYVLRAATRCIATLMLGAYDALRVRNSVVLVTLASVTYIPVRESVGTAQVAGALLLEFDRVRDCAPFTGG